MCVLANTDMLFLHLQVSAVPFSLEHLSHFFLESRRLRGGVGCECHKSPAPQIVEPDTSTGIDLNSSNITEQDLIGLNEDMDCF